MMDGKMGSMWWVWNSSNRLLVTHAGLRWSNLPEITQVVEVPEEARNIRFHTDAGKLPAKYRQALQDVR